MALHLRSAVILVLCLAAAAMAAEEQCSAPDSCASATCKEVAPPTRASSEDAKDTRVFEVVLTSSANTHGDVAARLRRSLAVQNIKFTELPTGSSLTSKTMKDHLAQRKSDVVMVLNGNDFIFAGDQQEILQKFTDSKARFLFGAQRNCDLLCDKAWPTVPEEPLAPLFMDASSVIATTKDLHDLLATFGAGDARHNLSTLYLENADSGIKLDSGCAVFQNLKYMGDDVEDDYIEIEMVKVGTKSDPRAVNKVSGSKPCVIHGAGNFKLLDQIGNYVPLVWTPEEGCIECNEHNLCLNVEKPGADAPLVFVDFAVEFRSPFLDVVLEMLLNQTYPKDKMILRFTVEKGPFAKTYQKHVANWTASNKDKYAGVEVTMQGSESLLQTRANAFKAFDGTKASHLLRFSSSAYLSEHTAIVRLVNMKRHVSSVLITRTGKLFSNYWGSMTGDFASQCRDESESCQSWTEQGECEHNAKFMAASCPLSCNLCAKAGLTADIDYKRAFDYGQIVNLQKRGIWNVPFASTVVLLDKAAAAHLSASAHKALASSAAADKALVAESNSFYLNLQDSLWLHEGEFFINLNNELFFGDLIDSNGYDATKLSPDMYLLENNWRPWGRQYLHANYSPEIVVSFVKDTLNDSKMCWDIFNFPLVNDRFCDELVAQSEHYGKWSGADKYGGQPTGDERLSGGYEPVPTQDIHFTQKGMDFAQTWYYILKWFINPIVETAFPGYSIEGRQTLDFIVKYRPDGQPFLRPHHDASTISVNIALNHIGVDFEGGGTRFLRQNCTILTNKKGHALFHPGRLTHQHEGLYVTKGTRYILVSFVDQ